MLERVHGAKSELCLSMQLLLPLSSLSLLLYELVKKGIKQQARCTCSMVSQTASGRSSSFSSIQLSGFSSNCCWRSDSEREEEGEGDSGQGGVDLCVTSVDLGMTSVSCRRFLWDSGADWWLSKESTASPLSVVTLPLCSRKQKDLSLFLKR